MAFVLLKIHHLTAVMGIIKRVLLNCKGMLDREWNNFLRNPVGYLETLVYLELRLFTRTFYVPFELELLWCISDGNCEWRTPRLKSRDGFPLCLTICIGTLLTGLFLVFASIALSDKFVFMRHGMFTPDALLYALVFLMLVASYVFVMKALLCRYEFATMFNAYVAFSENFAGKYFGKMGILQVAKEKTRICTGLLIAFADFFVSPAVMAVGVYVFRDSPVLTHSYADGSVTIKSKLYYALLVADWAGISLAIVGNLFGMAMIATPLIGIASALLTLRWAEENSVFVLSLKKKRSLHAQMEILTNLLNNVLGDIAPAATLISLLVVVSSNVLIAKIEGSQFSGLMRYPLFLTVLATYSSIITVAGFTFFRLAESVSYNSVQLLRSIQEQATRFNGGNGGRRRREAVAFGRMLGKRKSLKLRFGHFSAIAEGYGISYVLSILEHTVNGFFMVDPKSGLSYLL